MTGYGSSEKPVPWLGPQKWIKEVHWPQDGYLSMLVSFSTRVETGPIAAVCTATAVGSVALNSTISFVFHWPSPPDPPYPPYPPVPPQNGSARQAKAGRNINPDEAPTIQPSDISFTGYPNLPGTSALTWAPWTIFAVGITREEPKGTLIDVRVPGQSGSSRSQFRSGTSVDFIPYVVPFVGPFACYGGFVGDVGGRQGRPIAGNPSTWGAYSQKLSTINVDFSSLVATYKGRKYKVVGRYMQPPYGKPSESSSNDDSLRGQSVSLLLKKQKK